MDETARAEVANVDRTTLWRWRKDKQRPSLPTVYRLAERFGISVDDLIEAA